MNSLQLGDYKGQRDTLQTAMGTAYSPLENIQAAARAFGVQGMAGAGAQRLERMKEDFMQQATLDAAMTAEKVATTAYDRSVDTATALGESQNKVMETKNAGALAAQKAAAEAAKGVVTDAEKQRLKVLAGKNKGQILAHKAAFKAVLDSLGQDHPYYGHLQSTLALLDQLEQDEDHDRVFGGLSGINSNPAEVIRQAEQLHKAQEDAKKRGIDNKKPPEPTKLFNFKNRTTAQTTPTPASTGNLFNFPRRQ